MDRLIYAKSQERTRNRPIGSRQSMILAYARTRVAGGQSFPTAAEIASFIGYPHGLSGIETSILGLSARGLIVATTRRRTLRGTFPDGWQITDTGWAAP